ESTFDAYEHDGVTYYSHQTKIHGHDVGIGFSPSRIHADAYSVNYGVNDSHSRKPYKMDPKHAKDIQNHIRTKIHQFIQERKPKILGFVATDGSSKAMMAKQHVYKKFGKSLESKYGIKVHAI